MADRDAGGEVETLEGPQAPGSNGRERLRFDRLFVLATVLVLAGLVGGWLLVRGGGPAPSPGGAASPLASTGPSAAAGGPDFEAIVREIYAARTRAIVEGRPELVDEFYSEQCSCNGDLKKRIQEGGVVQQGQRLVGFEPRVLLVKVIDWPLPHWATLRVVDDQLPYRVLDKEGGQAESPGWPAISRSLDLWREEDGRWRVRTLLDEGPPDKVLGPDWRRSSPKG